MFYSYKEVPVIASNKETVFYHKFRLYLWYISQNWESVLQIETEVKQRKK